MIEQIAAATLLNALWEPLVVAAVAYVVLRCAKNASASTRYGVLSVALFAALFLPVTSGIAASRVAAKSQPAVITAVSNYQPVATRIRPKMTHVRVTAPNAVASTPHIALPAVQRLQLTLPHGVVEWILGVWAIVALALVLRLAISFFYLERLKRDAMPLDVERRENLRRWQATNEDVARVRLCVSDQTSVPVAVGWFDSMILIPHALVDELESEDLDRIILHEIAHLHRGDSFVNTVQRFACALFFFSPALAWIAHQLDLEREVACDDWVVSQSAEAAPYANCLLRLAERTPWPHRALPTPGAFITRKSMSIRIERILRRTRNVRTHAAPAPVAGAVALVGAVAIGSFLIAPSIAYSADGASATRPKVAAKAEAPVKVQAAVKVRAFGKQERPVKAQPAVKLPLVKESALMRSVEPAQARVRVDASAITPRPKPAVRPAPKPNPPVRVRQSAAPAPQSTPEVIAKVDWPAANAQVVSPATDGDFIDQMNALFGRKLTIEELVELKNDGVTPEYVQQLRAAGLQLDPRLAAEARAVGVTPQVAADFRAQFGTLPIRDVIELKAVGVTRDYIASLQGAGLSNLSARQVEGLKAVGVTPEYIRQINTLGFGKLSAREVEEVKAVGVDADYIGRVRAHGFDHLTLRQLVELKTSGVIK